ncbi:MAG: FKBP-type peptidyl-prolyl cis-trans isomerase [Gammaproteobacteria bacterium]
MLPLMRVGARWLVTIPPDLAYGVNGAGAAIGPNETLIFEIDLLEIGGGDDG